MTQQPLPFFDFSESSRRQFHHLLEERPLSDRGRAFCRLAYDACTEHAVHGLRTRYFDQTLLVSCSQERLAELLGCSARTVQRELDDLERLGVIERERVVPKTDGPPVAKTVYLIFPDRLAALTPLDPTDELDCVILARDGDLRGRGRIDHPELAPAASTGDVASPVVSVVASPVVSPVVSVVARDVVSLSDDHHELNESITHDDHSLSTPPRKSIVAIAEDDVRRIGGFAVGGQSLTATDRWWLFLGYWRSACEQQPPPDASEQLDLLALFIHWSRRATSKSRGAAVAVWWRSRNTKPLDSTLTPDNRRDAEQLRRSATSPKRQPVSAAGPAASPQPRASSSLLQRAATTLPQDSPLRQKLLNRLPRAVSEVIQ